MIIAFMIVATVFALASIGYVVTDLVLASKNREETKDKKRK